MPGSDHNLTRRQALQGALRIGALAGLAGLIWRSAAPNPAGGAAAALAQCERCHALGSCRLPDGLKARRFFGKAASAEAASARDALCRRKDEEP